MRNGEAELFRRLEIDDLARTWWAAQPKVPRVFAFEDTCDIDVKLAQADVYYYAYGFDTGTEKIYYWYPAEDVIVTDTWVEYVAT